MGYEPFAPELKGPDDKVEIARRIRERDFPDVTEFEDMKGVLKAINAESGGDGVEGEESHP
jgi:hypothetical protein